jgi:hypothetical protein
MKPSKWLIVAALIASASIMLQAAFPVSAITDNFDRANAGNLGGNYGNDHFDIGGGSHSVNANKAECSGYCANYWSAATFGPDVEIYFTVTDEPIADAGQIGLGARIVDPDSVNVDGYRINIFPSAGVDSWRIQRVDDGVVTLLGDQFEQNISSGDSVGLEIIGSTIKAYYKPSAGSWTEITSRSDGTYTAAGYVGFELYNGESGSPTIDDFGAGSVGSAAGPKRLLILGVGGA